jgi:hypothetical protein
LSTLAADGKQKINQAQPSLKLSHLFDGLGFSRNFKLLALLSGFVLWLFVVYWIRHHEPLLHEVMGKGIAHSTTADADKVMLNGVKAAFPIKTSSQGYALYQPEVSSSDNAAQHYAQDIAPEPKTNASSAYANVGPGQAISAPTFAEAKFGLPRGYALEPQTVESNNVAEPILTSKPAPSVAMQVGAPIYSNPVTALNHYYLPIHSPNGTYLKTVVNR